MRKEATVTTILKRIYHPVRYLLMSEVQEFYGKGFRTIDYMAMGLSPVKGLHLEGIEVKKKRLDWIREMKTPEKSKAILQYCDKFWLLTVGSDIATINEIPENWGWMEIIDGQIYIRKEAPMLDPIAMSKAFLSRLMIKASSKEGWVKDEDVESIKKYVANVARLEAEEKQYETEDKYEDLLKTVQKYQKETGIDITKWQFSTQ